MDDRFVIVLAGVVLVAGMTHAHTKGQYEPELARLNDRVEVLQREKDEAKAQLQGALMIRR